MSKLTFINREISWLRFNHRVLQEAQDKRNPLVERFRFLGIFSNNLDEFFRVRVASIRRMVGLQVRNKADFNEDPQKVLQAIMENVLGLQREFDQLFESLVQELADNNIQLLRETKLSRVQRRFVKEYFHLQVRPYLIPVMLRSKGPFPEMEDATVYFAIRLYNKETPEETSFALMEIPKVIPRFIQLPPAKGKHAVMFLDDVIRYNLKNLFSFFDFDTHEAFMIKITRDSELDIDDDISLSLMEKLSKSVSKRKSGAYVRLIYDREMPSDLFNFIVEKIGVSEPENVIAGGRYHNKKDFSSFPDFGIEDLVFPAHPPLNHPDLNEKRSLFAQIKRRDVMLHYPYQKFDYIIDLLREAAIDPDVRSIRINIYRVARNSHVLHALINAVKNGKKVIAVIELRARFDEDNNMHWSKVLQENGVKVIHGIPGLKVHAKLLLITRKEEGKSVLYGHVGTGNFNGETAMFYTDFALLTHDIRITRDLKRIFDFFENNYERKVYRHLIVSPHGSRRKFMKLIQNEIDNALAGKKAWIRLKLNSVVDGPLIKKLYQASEAGVEIQLVVRGICSLVPGQKGLSENISVRSIVGRYLEHGRFFIFCNDEKPLYFLSSADWMTRNMDFRLEVSVPVYDERLCQRLEMVFQTLWRDNMKARLINREGLNNYVTSEGEQHESQEELYRFYSDLKRKTKKQTEKEAST